MIKHIVLFKFAEHAKPNDIYFIMEKFSALQQTSIPQIRSFIHGKSCSPENLEQSYNYGFIMEFKNKGDRDFYITHKDHLKIVEENLRPLLKADSDSVLVFDI